MKIKYLTPINTKYSGVFFRSRLEARWAVFFDSLGIKWEYEKDTYNLDGVLYCPDFWMPDQDCWIEIKGQEPTEMECEKLKLLSEHSGKKSYIFFREIPFPFPEWNEQSAYQIYPYWDNFFTWVECMTCGKFGIVYCGKPERLECHQDGEMHSRKLLTAYEKSRLKRFF